MTQAPLADPIRLPSAAVVFAFAAGAALLASAAPLLAYAGSLALFGAPHVIAELRYVDGRFSRRIGFARGVAILTILCAVVALRALGLLGRIDPADAYGVELGLVAVLAFVVAPSLFSSPPRAALALAVGAAIAIGSALAPWTTVVVLAFLHNATPVGFLAERLAGTRSRRPAMRTCAILFIVVPAAISTGLGSRALDAVGLRDPDASFGSVGPLSDHLRVFVPTEWLASPAAAPLFAAAAYLQLLHYGAVLGVLPRLLGAQGTPGDRPAFPWPRFGVLTAVIAAVGLLSAAGFVHDFAGTRAQYGLLASVHAWIEIPVLLLALAPRTRSAAPGTGASPRTLPKVYPASLG